MRDTVLFGIWPYAAVLLMLAGIAYRILIRRPSLPSCPPPTSLERSLLFWGAVPWYLGVLPTLLIHLGGFTVPAVMAFLHGTPFTLYAAELFGKVLAFMAFAGILILILRRLTQAGVRVVTSPLDWIVLLLLLNQVFLGLWTALFYRWGAAWFIYTATPWIWSLATFHPQPEYVTALPWVPKLHFLNASLLFALFPFSNLVHLVTYPFAYAWGRLQGILRSRRAAQ